MTTYLTVADFIAQFGEAEVLAIAGIGGPNSAGGRQVDEPKVQAALDRAASLVDGYVLARYPALADLTQQEIPAALAGAVADIARWFLRDKAGDKGAVDEVVRQRYEDALTWLRRVQSGEVDLASETPGLLPVPDGPLGPVRAEMPASRTEAALKGWRP